MSTSTSTDLITPSLYGGNYATRASTGQARFAPGQRWAFFGDSITAGTGAVFGVQYAYLLPSIVGTSRMRECAPVGPVTTARATSFYSQPFGIAGQTSAQILARLTTNLDSAGPIAGVTVLAGTNDIAQGVPISVWQTSLQTIAAICRQRGLPLVLGTIPPWGIGRTSATIRKQIAAMNLWLRLWAATAGVTVADVWAALADPTTGDYVTTYDSGDGIHPNNLGHYKIAATFASAIGPLLPSLAPVLVTAGFGAAANPLISGTIGSTLPSSWSNPGGGSGTAATYSTLAASDGLTAGQWLQIDLDGTTATSVQSASSILSGASLVPGDLAMLVASVEVLDAGSLIASLQSNASWCALSLTNGANTSQYAGIAAGNVVGSIQQLCSFFTVPAGVTSGVLRFTAKVASGSHGQFRLGACNVYDIGALAPGINLLA